MKILLDPDETIASGPSPEAADTANVSNAASKGDETQEKTLLDTVQDALKSGQTSDASASSAKDDAAKSGSENEQDKGKADATEEGKEAQGEEETEGTTEGKEGEQKEEVEEKGPVPYERFEEINQKAATLTETVGVLKPRAENYDKINGFCQEYSITPEQFEQVLKIQALLNTNPEQALKELQPIVDELQGYVGGKLPPDLQKAVDAQEISPELAKRMASLEAKLKFGSSRTEHDRKAFEERQQAELQRRMTDAVKSWETSKRTNDPDYKPKATGKPDGKWEEVNEKFLALFHQINAQGQYVNPVRNEAEMTALLDRAYKAVTERYSSRTSKSATRKTLSSNGSSSTSNKTKPIEEYSSLQEAVSARLG